MKCGIEEIYKKLGIIFLCIITVVFFALATRAPEAMGESDDYMLATEALQNHFSIRITEEDVEKAKLDFPEHAWYFESSWETGMPALFTIKEGEVYPWYMGTYSLACIPMKLCLQFLQLNQSYAFALTNAVFAALALWICWCKLKTGYLKKLILIIILGISPIWWYIRWPSSEVFIFAMVVISLVCFYNRNHHLAGLAVSLAGTLNIAIMALGLFMIIDYIKVTYCRYAQQGEKNVLKIVNKERKDIILLIICYLPSLITPLFNVVKFGIMNLQSILGFATVEGYINRVMAHLFDLNIGFLPYFPIAFVLFCVLAIFNIFRRKWSAFIYFAAFMGTVMLYSVTYHINSGMSGLPRYSAWTFPIFAFYLVAENVYSRKLANNVVAALIMVSTMFTVNIVKENHGELVQTSAAKWVLSRFPNLYNPYYPIFISRIAHIPGGYTPYQEEVPAAIAMGKDYETYFPVIYSDDSGNVRKILTIPELNDKLLNYFDGTVEDLDALAAKIQKASSKKGLYYINLSGNLKIRDEYFNKRFSYTFGDTLKAGNRIPLGRFMTTEEGKIDEDGIYLPAGAYEYGPYMSLEKGVYSITIKGEKLLDFAEDVLIDNELAAVDVIEENDETITYILELKKDARSVELRGLNQGKETIRITQIYLDNIEVDR